jgi:hypothetical protein
MRIMIEASCLVTSLAMTFAISSESSSGIPKIDLQALFVSEQNSAAHLESSLARF